MKVYIKMFWCWLQMYNCVKSIFTYIFIIIKIRIMLLAIMLKFLCLNMCLCIIVFSTVKVQYNSHDTQLCLKFCATPTIHFELNRGKEKSVILDSIHICSQIMEWERPFHMEYHAIPTNISWHDLSFYQTCS